jgi:hypothetical protein
VGRGRGRSRRRSRRRSKGRRSKGRRRADLDCGSDGGYRGVGRKQR